jgi:hypothetical protein
MQPAVLGVKYLPEFGNNRTGRVRGSATMLPCGKHEFIIERIVRVWAVWPMYAERGLAVQGPDRGRRGGSRMIAESQRSRRS